mgnify:CR=1 FL=1
MTVKKDESNGYIGHNSKNINPDANVAAAVKELYAEIKAYAKNAEDYYFSISEKFKQVVTGNAPLTKKQEEWNWNVDTYNDWIMETKPNPATNKKYLRKKYKAEKLSKEDIYDLQRSIQRNLDDQWDDISNITAAVNALQDPKYFEEDNNE